MCFSLTSIQLHYKAQPNSVFAQYYTLPKNDGDSNHSINNAYSDEKAPSLINCGTSSYKGDGLKILTVFKVVSKYQSTMRSEGRETLHVMSQNPSAWQVSGGLTANPRRELDLFSGIQNQQKNTASLFICIELTLNLVILSNKTIYKTIHVYETYIYAWMNQALRIAENIGVGLVDCE